jgi:hypothetical protein
MGALAVKRNKDDVDYSQGKPNAHCGICEHYRPDYQCDLVKGIIRPECWCKLFDKKD